MMQVVGVAWLDHIPSAWAQETEGTVSQCEGHASTGHT